MSVSIYSEKLKEINKNLQKSKRKVADHDHLTGKFRGAAHNICNLNYKNPGFIPIFYTTWQAMMRTCSSRNLVRMMKT